MNHSPFRFATSRWLLLFALAACLGTATLPAHATTNVKPGTRAGMLQGALYRIDIPEHWNGDLVMVMHGYQPVGGRITTPMTAADATPVFLKQGYAVAQSQYASQGWAVGDAIADTERLREYFIHTVAQPARSYIYGFSLGGLEVAASIERYPHAYTGALITCGGTISTPEFISRLAITPLLAFDTLIPGILPDLAAPGSPPAVPRNVFAKALQAHPEQAALLEKRLQETADTLPGELGLYYMALREIEQRAGGLPLDNRQTVYHGFGDDAAFNCRVYRYAGSPAAIAYAQRNVTLTGQIDIPLVMQWNVFDPTIPERFHDIYPEQVRAAGRGKLLTILAPVGQTHCNFTDEQTVEQFKTLVDTAGGAGR